MPVDLTSLPALLPRLPHLARAMARTRRKITRARAAQAFWPLASVSLTALAAARLPLPETFAPPLFALGSTALLASLAWGLARFWPAEDQEAFEALDAQLPHFPLTTLLDQPATTGALSEALWQEHLRRAEDAVQRLKPAPAPWALSQSDRFGLRYIALLLALGALILGRPLPLPESAPLFAHPESAPALAEASWEGWITPPAFTGAPVLYLPDQPEGPIDLPQGSQITLRFYGAPDVLRLSEGISGQSAPFSGDEITFDIVQDGPLLIEGVQGAEWTIGLLPDHAPTIAFETPRKTEANGVFAWPFSAEDDYAVVSARAIISLDLEKIDRKFGLATAPQNSAPIVRELALPFTRARQSIAGLWNDDFSKHPYAGLPVQIVLEATDAAGQIGQSAPLEVTLPGKRFFEPTAKAVGEMRRDLLWSPENAERITTLLRAVTYRGEELFRTRLPAQRLAQVARDLARTLPEGPQAEQQEAMAEQLWKAAVQLEEGSLADARARLERAKERLAEAMRSGASPEEIAELMAELRAATEAYLDLLAESAEPADPQLDSPPSEGAPSVSQDQIQALMDRIQELMEEGRMAEASELMAQLSALLENLRMQESEGGEGRGSPRPDQKLQDSLREQQDLADDAFRELQEEFSRNRQSQSGMGQNAAPQGEGGTEGQNGTEGQEGQSGAQTPQGGPDSGAGRGEASGGAASLAERQEALRQTLEDLEQNLPPALEGEALDAARDAMGRARSAMEEAEDNLAQNRLAEAIQNQAEALEALREGLSQMRQAMDAAQTPPPDDSGESAGEAQSARPDARDPLGRRLGQGGTSEGGDQVLPDGGQPRLAEELRDELRRRAGERERSQSELDYLRRLLENY